MLITGELKDKQIYEASRLLTHFAYEMIDKRQRFAGLEWILLIGDQLNGFDR